MNPTIEKLEETILVGNRIRMSFQNNQTMSLWQRFMPRRKEITNSVGPELYSVEVYDNPDFFKHFNPSREFEKWAGVKVNSTETVPDNMDVLVIPAGEYAVFLYKGKPSDAPVTYQYIFDQWIPNSEYKLDDRPHFARMGEKYKGEHPDSEEEIWIPISKR